MTDMINQNNCIKTWTTKSKQNQSNVHDMHNVNVSVKTWCWFGEEKKKSKMMVKNNSIIENDGTYNWSSYTFMMNGTQISWARSSVQFLTIIHSQLKIKQLFLYNFFMSRTVIWNSARHACSFSCVKLKPYLNADLSLKKEVFVGYVCGAHTCAFVCVCVFEWVSVGPCKSSRLLLD